MIVCAFFMACFLSAKAEKIISIDFEYAPIATIIESIADQSGSDIVVDKTVSGFLTIKLSEQPWREILQAVLTTAGYECREYGNVIYVGTPEKFKAERSQKQILSVYKIRTLDLDDVINVISSMLSKGEWVLPDERTNQVLVYGSPEIQEDVERYLKENDVKMPQIIVAVRSIIVTAKVNEAIEQRWHFPLIEVPLNKIGFLLNTEAPLVGYLEAKVEVIDNEELNAILSMVSDLNTSDEIVGGILRVQNNCEGMITTGQRFGIVLRDIAGNATVQFFSSGFKLRVVPHITGTELLRLNIQFELSSLDKASALTGTPIINTYNSDVEIHLKSGETGIIARRAFSEAANRRRNPVLLSIPLISWFFQPWSKIKNSGYQYILVTPIIVY